VSANVRCAGGGLAYLPSPEGPEESDVSCGWKGERFPSGYVHDHIRSGITEEVSVEARRRMTAKPCPRCGGQVVLTPQETAP
jgi:hypothetical protein